MPDDINDHYPIDLSGVGIRTAIALCKISDYFTIMVEAVCGTNLTPHKMHVAALKTELERAAAAGPKPPTKPAPPPEASG